MHHLERFLIKEMGRIYRHLAVVQAAGLALPGKRNHAQVKISFP